MVRQGRRKASTSRSAGVLTAVNQSVVVFLVRLGGIVRLLELDGDLSGRLSVGTVAHGQLAKRTNGSGKELLQNRNRWGYDLSIRMHSSHRHSREIACTPVCSP